MKHFALFVLCCACLSYNSVCSQEEELQLTSKDSIVESSWMIGLGYNFVDDSGDMLDELFSFDDQWNTVAFPSRVSIGRYFKSGIGVEGIATYNKYKVGKLIDGVTNLEATNYFGLDARLSYDLNKIIGETAWFDPYVGVGLGYTKANNQPRGTYNAIIGFRTWFSDRWGLDLSSSGKWAMDISKASNHLQHAAGVVYRFGIEKGLSKKGEEKLALNQALQAEKQQQMDSIAAADREKAATALAERLAQEKEAAQLAAAEKARQDAENRRKRQIEDEIDALGLVYFALNSSYLDTQSKSILDALTVLLKENDGIVLKVSSYTDSRGTSTYNDWLSRKRVERTVGYLIQQGIAAERLQPEAYGEENLLNECDDTTYCPEEKHKINRRSEFKVLKF
ncbi:Outer membrane protein OmpA [Pricia antarctica]|uniref:Outer membrane protein OmpA n=1 Tax=Pricia antarctica TaxID=641691 RepID=A0A1G7FJF4_9FLAO|nr:OmpA family protein [Pricia antarctica]SDE76013.1 Outer membrane protein OmpA [Pricia antarctica]